jgi:ElaB/YqjD/DUF883 family membrane-anchored ribosome-binding protein
MNATEADIKTLRSELTQLREDMAKISETFQALARHGAMDAMGKIKDSTEDLREHVKRKTENITQQIEEKPVAAALTSFAVGIALGALFGGRRA